MWRQRQGHFQHTKLSKGCAEIWYCYLFPLSFITASFLRPNTVASAVYIVLAFLALVLPASFANRYEPCRWHRLHLCICLLCGSLLIAAATLLILCRQAVLQPDAVYLVKLFFFGDANCHDKSNLLPEILAFVAAFLGWILGCYVKRMEESPAVDSVDVWDNPLMSPRRLILVAAILFSSASLDFNLFALVYHIATLLIVLYWARAKRSRSGKELHWAQLLCLRIALLTVCSVQVSSVAIFSLPGIPQFFSSPMARLLGLEVSIPVCWQNLSSFLLIQLLVWPAQRAKRLPTQMQDRRTAEEAPSPFVSKYAEDQAVLHEKEAQNRGEHPDGDEIREGSDGASPWKSVADKANYVCGRALLPLFSMMSLFMVWPSLTTLPLLLAGFSLHHIPVERFPIVFFYGALVYEMLCSIVWFCYNIFCTMSDQPLSMVPYEFTWLERGGLQCYLRKGPADPEVRRYIFALGQGLAVVATAACTRSRSCQEQQSPAGNPSRPCAGGWASSALVRKVVAFSRPFTVSFVVVVILGQNSPNVFGMLYLIWLVGLTISGAWASYINSGWDLLRANELTWRSLLVLSNCIVLALAYCQVMESTNLDFVGLERSSQTILEVTWAHLTIGVLAGLQTLAFSQKVQIPAMFVDSNSALAWFLWIGGIFIEMGLMLNFVMMEPLTVDSFFILTLFLGIVAVEQFGAPTRWRNWLLTATAFSCSLLLLLRYTLLMPKVQEWLDGASSPLPQEKFDMLWKAFALGDTSFEVRLKLGYLAATTLLSTALRRLYRFGAAASLIGARSQVYTMKNKVAMSIFLEAARWSTVVLICTCYFIMPLKNALSHLQLAVLIIMLMSGRCWDYAGGFISLTSSVTLLVQYAYTFKLVELPADEADYWGLHQQGYYAEVALLLIGIVQRTVKRLSLHFLSNTTIAAQLNEEARERRRRIRQETVAYGAQIGATILLLTAMVCNSAWSVVYVSAILLYVCKKESRRASSACTSNSWLRLFVLLLALSLAISLAIKAWLPPDILQRPSIKDIANLLCQAYADSPAGESCKIGGCQSQRYLCGQSWAFWVGFIEPEEAPGDTTFTFMAFFSVCLVRHICLVEIGKDLARKDSKDDTDSEKMPSQELVDSTSPTQVDAEVTSEEGRKWSDALPQLFIIWSSFVLTFSLALTALLQPRSNLFTLGYLSLLVWYIFSAEGVRGGETTLASRSNANKWILACNLVVAFALCLFQCPAVPCPFATSIECGEEACPRTFMVSPSLCMELSERSSISLNGSWQPLTMLLEWIGVQKFPEGLNFVWCKIWIFLVFVASLMQDLTFDRWNERLHSHLCGEVKIRSLRERWYHEHLLHWRRYELRRIDMKHKVLMVKLQSLMSYIGELRAIWESKRGELTVQEKAQRARGDRILSLCLQSGHAPQVVEPLLEEFSAEAALTSGPFERLLSVGAGVSSAALEEDKLSAKDTTTWEVVHLEAIESINSCVLEHLQDIQLQRLRRISSQDLSERKIQLLQRCAAIGEETCSSLTDSAALSKEPEVPSEHTSRSSTTLRLKGATSRSRSKLKRQETQEFPKEKDTLTKVLGIVKAKVVQLMNLAVSGLVDDFLYTCDAVETLQSHRRHDGFLTLMYKAFWSQTLPLLLVVSLVHFTVYTSVVSAMTICAIVASLMSFPHQHPLFWKMLIYFNLCVVLVKVLYQLPIFPVSVDTSGLQEDLEHGLFSGIPVPWESVLGLIKVAPKLSDEDETISKELAAALKQLESRNLFRSSLLGLLWPDLLVFAFLVFHWHTLRNSGRLANPARICCRLAMDDLKNRKGGRHLTLYGMKEAAGPKMQKNLTRGLSELPTSPCAQVESKGYCLEALTGQFRNMWRAMGLRKPAMDFFVVRAGLMMCCFCIILISWERLVEGGESFADSLTSNSFSGEQVAAVVVFLVLMVQVRAEYTWYTQWRGPEAKAEDKRERKDIAIDSRGASAARSVKSPGTGDVNINTAVFLGQRILFLTELIGLHSIFIVQWAISATNTPRMSNSVQLAFYLFFMLYLIFTSLQMRYDVHVTSGGLGFTHSMDLFTSIAFKVYLAIPFVEEMRVLTDWTITRTSMDFFMWMKLEDTQQSLYRTKRDFYLRRWYPPAAPRPGWEKVLQGGLLLVGLIVLIVAPIALFSTLNPSLQANRLTSATLSGNLIVQSSAEGIRQMRLYRGSQVSIVQELVHSDMSRDAAEVSFGALSEETFDSQTVFQARVAQALGEPDVTAWFQFKYQLEFNGDTLKGVTANAVHRVALDKNTTLDIGNLVNESLSQDVTTKAAIRLPAALQATLRVNSNLEVSFLGDWFDLYLTFQSGGRAEGWGAKDKSRGRWRLGKSNCKDADLKLSGEALECPITQLVASEKSAPVPVGASSSWSVMGIYLGVVYTIGRLLRVVFQDSSKRVIYEEIPDTSLLEDLCNGIYIARIQHLLRTEYKLYYQLMSILRSPELLLNVTGNFCDQNFDDEVNISAAMDDYIPRFQGGAKTQSEQWLTTVGEVEQESEETYVVPEASEPPEDLRVLDEMPEDLGETFVGVADPPQRIEDSAQSPTSPFRELRRRNQGYSRGHSHTEM